MLFTCPVQYVYCPHWEKESRANNIGDLDAYVVFAMSKGWHLNNSGIGISRSLKLLSE